MLFKIIFVVIIILLIRNIVKGIATFNKMKEAVEQKQNQAQNQNDGDVIDAEFKVINDD